ncbi:MAG: NUDIX hydrolase [Gemmatimonadetes bacterium]|nr:NUDIX hydrolase [Gemmatimonadota bacterium]
MPTHPPGRLDSRPVHDGRIVHLSVDTVRFPDGSVGELEMIRHSGAAAVLPILGHRDEIDPEILLIRQYRYASDGYLYEVPAGRRDGTEDWHVCARRELEEETGYLAGDLEKLTAIYTTPGFTDEVIHLFIAYELSAGALAQEADEFIDLVRLPFSDALGLIRDGEITDAKTICTLLFARTFLLPNASR